MCVKERFPPTRSSVRWAFSFFRTCTSYVRGSEIHRLGHASLMNLCKESVIGMQRQPGVLTISPGGWGGEFIFRSLRDHGPLYLVQDDKGSGRRHVSSGTDSVRSDSTLSCGPCLCRRLPSGRFLKRHRRPSSLPQLVIDLASRLPDRGVPPGGTPFPSSQST